MEDHQDKVSAYNRVCAFALYQFVTFACGTRVFLPEFVTVRSEQCDASVTLKSGELYEDSIEFGDDPVDDALTLVEEVFEAIAMSTPALEKRDSVHGEAPVLRHTRISA